MIDMRLRRHKPVHSIDPREMRSLGDDVRPIGAPDWTRGVLHEQHQGRGGIYGTAAPILRCLTKTTSSGDVTGKQEVHEVESLFEKNEGNTAAMDHASSHWRFFRKKWRKYSSNGSRVFVLKILPLPDEPRYFPLLGGQHVRPVMNTMDAHMLVVRQTR